jgi:hypothetical protein
MLNSIKCNVIGPTCAIALFIVAVAVDAVDDEVPSDVHALSASAQATPIVSNHERLRIIRSSWRGGIDLRKPCVRTVTKQAGLGSTCAIGRGTGRTATWTAGARLEGRTRAGGGIH